MGNRLKTGVRGTVFFSLLALHNPKLNHMKAGSHWTIWQKIAFRFFFLFLGLSSIVAWHLIIYFIKGIFSNSRDYDFMNVYSFLGKALHWFDRIFFHVGYDPKVHMPLPADNHYGVVFYLAVFMIAVIGTVAWSILDRNRPNYKKLSYWFNLCLRYMLALVLFGYGMDKLVPIQMPYPDVSELLTPLGEENRFSVLWDFMGVSPGFQMFTGACELIGSLLLTSRRTALAGYMVLLIVLINVVAFNIFYNIPVKLFSSLLLASLLYLLIPYMYRLVQLFFYKKPVFLSDTLYRFQSNVKTYTLKAILIIVPFVAFLIFTILNVRKYKRNLANSKNEKLYEVLVFIAKDTLPPLLTDTLRWRRLLFANANDAIVCNMRDEKTWYKCDRDTLKKTFTLQDGTDSSAKYLFHYDFPQADQMNVTGKWKGNDVSILMKSVPIDSMLIKKEKLVLMQD